MARLFPGTIFFLLAFVTFAQYDFNAPCIESYLAAGNLEFDRSKHILETESREHPENLVPLLVNNYIDFLQVVIGEQEQDFQRLKVSKGNKINQLEKGPKDSPYYLYSLATINLQMAMARMKFNDYTRAALEARKAYFLLKANQQEYPDFTPNLIGLGLLHTLIGTIPDQYLWVAKLFGMEGSVVGGIMELQEAARILSNGDHSFLLPECLFFITFLSMNFQPDIYLDVQFLSMLDSSYNDHIMLQYAYARYLMKSGNNDRAIDVLTYQQELGGQYPFYYLDYLLGKAKLSRLDKDASQPLYTFAVNFKGANYIKACYQKIAWHNLVHGDEQGYIDNMGKVLKYGQDIVDDDKQAMMEAENKAVPNVDLLKSRLLFDGGYYMAAESILLNPNIFLASLKDTVEYSYRLGRICHSMGKHEQAKVRYMECIEKGSHLPNYFAANAALHLGMIFEEEGDLAEAGRYYTDCTRMDFTEYKASITQKAKAGLDRVKR